MKNLIKKYLPECVYGGVDGLVTTFAIVTASIGIGATSGVILVLGIANVLADAWSMGSSDYLSAHSEAELEGGEHDTNKPPIKTAFATFAAFVVVGFVPLVPFMVALALPLFEPYAVLVSIGSTMATFAIVGYVSGSVSGARPLVSSARTLVVGAVAAIIAFGVGYLLRDFA